MMRNEQMVPGGLCAMAVLACLAGGVSADIQTFTSRSAMVDEFPEVTVESFEGLAATNTLSSEPIVAGEMTCSPSSDQDNRGIAIYSGQLVGAGPTAGVKWLGHQSDIGHSLRFEFAGAQRVFGLDIVDWGDFTNQGMLRLISDSGLNEEVAIGPKPNGNQMFFGVYHSGGFTAVELVNTMPGEFYGVDQVTYAVPEPAGLSLLGWGGLLLMRRRRLPLAA